MRARRLAHEGMLHDPGRTESLTIIVASLRSFGAIALLTEAAGDQACDNGRLAERKRGTPRCVPRLSELAARVVQAVERDLWGWRDRVRVSGQDI
jgi:hypothetical protein